MESGYGTTRATYGGGSERLSQNVAVLPETPGTVRTDVARENGKSYFQSDLLGSALFASNQQGEVLRYAERDAWGDLNSPGMGDGLRFTNHGYDQVIDKYFAQARFYDSGQGRMLAVDPIKSGINAYLYCMDNPTNYVDPTGEIAHILLGTTIGGITGGIFGFVGSVASQKLAGKKVNYKKALGSAANGAVVGAVRGTLASTGAGVVASLASNLVAGTVGSALEQKISKGKVNARKAITDGLTNAASAAVYGRSPLKSAKDAFVRGASSGAVVGAINSLSKSLKSSKKTDGGKKASKGKDSSGPKGRMPAPSISKRDPKGSCKAKSPFGGKPDRAGYGYDYGDYGTKNTNSLYDGKNQRNGFNIGNFTRDVVLSALVGGTASASFYGAEKAVGAIGKGIRKIATRGTSAFKEFMKDNRGGINVPNGGGKIKLPNETVVKENGVRIKHNSTSNDHGNPVHLHVTGKGQEVRIGPMGKPLKGDPELSIQQIKVVRNNDRVIKNTIKELQKWIRTTPK